MMDVQKRNLTHTVSFTQRDHSGLYMIEEGVLVTLVILDCDWSEGSVLIHFSTTAAPTVEQMQITGLYQCAY